MNKEEIEKKIEELEAKNEALIKELNKAVGLNAKLYIELDALKKERGASK